MAVDVNKRKRKHESAELQNDEVPKKVAKIIEKQQKLITLHSNDEVQTPEEVSQVNGNSESLPSAVAEVENGVTHATEPDEEHIKFSKDFKMLNFRTKLRGSNFISELRHFIHLAQSSPKILAKYIEKRGKPLEIVEALDRVDKSNLQHVAYVCQALQLVTMEIVSNQKSHMESAMHACRYFLKAHVTVTSLLLKSPQLQHRRIALKLLTAIVCIEPQLGRQILSSCDVLSNVNNIENFLSHSKFELNVEESVRKCFIHFVLAYLVEGNILLIRNILDRGALINALASGLVYDDSATVCLVLSTLQKYVLECAEISKTKKTNVFQLRCCRHFLRLYDWCGPSGYAAKINSKKGSFANLNSVEDSEAVAAAAHAFLLVLLTSRKFGIAFDAVKNFRQKRNVIQGKIIGVIFKPWCNERKADLVLQILNACPELARHSVRHFGGIINPMRTPQRDWVKAANFLKQIIDSAQPNRLTTALDNMTLTDLAFWIKDVCLPIETLALITGAKMLRHKDFKFRFATNRLLLSMFTQYSNYMSVIKKRDQTKGGNAMRRFKFDVLNHILTNFPTIEDILLSLYMSIQFQNDEGVFVLEHLDVALDIVLVVCHENRSFVNKTNTILDYLELLRPLYSNNDTLSADHKHITLELKAIKTILLLFPKALEPTGSIFQGVLRSFIKGFVFGTTEVQREAGTLLRKIFANTGIFDSSGLEIDIWLEALRFDTNVVDAVTQVFIEVFQVTNAEVDVPKSVEMRTDKDNIQKLFTKIEKGLSVQSYFETLTISKLLPLIYKGVEIVDPLDVYLETVCLLMYHYYSSPEYVLELYQMEFKTLKKYMKSWLHSSTDEPRRLHESIAFKIPHLCQLQNAILDGECSFLGLFETSSEVAELEVQLDGKLVQLNAILKNERLVMIYIQQVIFLVAQLVERQTLQREIAERAAGFLTNFIRIAQHLEQPPTDVEDDTDNATYLFKILKYIFTIRISYISTTDLFQSTEESHKSFVHFLCELTENCKDLKDFDLHTANYRSRIVKAIGVSMESVEDCKANSNELKECTRLVAAIELDEANCVEILELFAKCLSWNDLFIPSTTRRSIYYDLLVCVLHRAGSLQKAIKCDSFIRWFSAAYANMCKMDADVSVEQLEEAFRELLLISHQYIPQLGALFFACMFGERKLTKSSVKLALLLLERDDSLHLEFVKYLPEHMGKKELIYPLLKVILNKKVVVDESLLKSIYQEYKNGFIKAIEKPQKAGVIYKDNVECSIRLIELCMPKSECVDFCNKSFKFDVIELYQMRMINAIYKKAISTLDQANHTQKSSIFVNYINLQIQMMLIAFKKPMLEEEKIELFAYILYEWWCQAFDVDTLTEATVAEFTAIVDYEKVLASQPWMNFCKTCLKLCMHQGEVVDEEHRRQEDVRSLLLKLLAYLCDKMYADWLHSESKELQNGEQAKPAQLFEMIFTHSKFYDIVLSEQYPKIKTEVLHLLYTLAKKSPSALNVSQIPIILGSYQATLSLADRYSLAILHLYEIHDCGLEQYRPFIWGESAISFYALRATEEGRVKLTQQETTIAQVMSLIDKQTCEYTIENFPIWRKVNSLLQMPDVEFMDPDKKALMFGANALERTIELGEGNKLKEADLRLCPKRNGLYEQCYDPAFFVPLMNLCFAPEAYTHTARPVQNGLLSMVFAALSSQDRDMRLAAACGQLRYRTHFEQKKFFERPLWVQMYENIQTGLSELRTSWMQHKKNSGTPRVPFVSGLFIAKTVNLISDPTHMLYKQLAMYMRLKSTFNFQCVPEFNVLFYSAEVEHHVFQEFIIEIIRNGVKSSSDLYLLVHTNTLRVLMGFYGSSMSTLKMNLMILSIFSTCVKIPASAKILIEIIGILPWLSSIVSGIEFHQFDIIEGLISIVNNLWYAMQASAGEFYNFAYLSLELHRLVLALLPHLSIRISLTGFAKLMNIMNKTAAAQCYAMPSEQLDKLIGCALVHYPTFAHSIENIRAHGGAGATPHSAYCKELYDQQLDAFGILALSSLRSYVIAWWDCRSKNEQSAEDVTAIVPTTACSP